MDPYTVQIYTEVVIKLYFGLVLVIRLDLYKRMENKSVKPEFHCLVIADFYQKNVHEGKFYSFKFFKHMGYQKLQVYTVLFRANAGDLVEMKKG